MGKFEISINSNSFKMTTNTFITYNKEYLPGYTGHVPKKNEVFGCTAGDINRLINKTG